MEIIDLSAEARHETGKGAARKLRRRGLIPAVVYRGGQEATALSIDPAVFEHAIRRLGNRNALLRLHWDGQERLCLAREVQRHPLSRQLLHVDFYEVRMDEPVEVRVRVEPVGRARGTRIGGKLKQYRRWIKVRCKPADIPPVIEVDVTSLGLNEFVRVADLPELPGVSYVYDENFNVLGVTGKGIKVESAEPEAGEAQA